MPLVASLSDTSPFVLAVLASLTAGLAATAAGALPVLAVRSLAPRVSNMMLSFAAGVMLAATVFSLLVPGFTLATAMLGARMPAALAVAFALCLGGLLMGAIHRWVPHEHFHKGHEGPGGAHLARVWLFVLAITVHNFPEGLSIGVGAASGDAAIALGVTVGIGIQNIPEGLVVAVALLGLGYGRWQAFGVAALTGAVELLGGIVGAALLEISRTLLPGALAFAAGTMLFVISDEVIPETHRAGFGDVATAALFIGFALMFVLDVALG